MIKPTQEMKDAANEGDVKLLALLYRHQRTMRFLQRSKTTEDERWVALRCVVDPDPELLEYSLMEAAKIVESQTSS